MNNTESWYDIILEAEALRESTLLRMTEAEWKEESKRIIHTWHGDLRACIQYLDKIDNKRSPKPVIPPPPPPPKVLTEFDIDFGLWKDMIDDPWKYGDEITEWLELDEKLTKQSGRWRLGAYWLEKEDEENRKNVQRLVNQQHGAATRIQAAVRGHMARNKQSFRNCYLCLSHCISPFSFQNENICSDCAIDAGVLGRRV